MSAIFRLCDERGLTLMRIRPVDVARYIETRQHTHSPPDVKQQLAAVRMLFDWLITGQIVPLNPAAAVREPKVKTGKTPVLDGNEWRTSAITNGARAQYGMKKLNWCVPSA
jgi:site-specific recombinase XerD